MLEVINNLKPFFEDCYRRINVREYARIMHISPPTASKILAYYTKEGLLIKSIFKNYILFSADKESKKFIDLSRIYWSHKLKVLTSFMDKKLIISGIVLFGSLSKAEVKSDSDIDLVVFTHKKELNLEVFEKKLKRKIQIFWFKSLKSVKSKELTNNILNGYILQGRVIL